MAVKISRILHAGYVFSTKQTQIVFDPIFENPFSVNCYAYPSVQFEVEEIKKLQLQAIFISHYHDDHCSFDSLKLLDKKIPIYLYCIHDEMFSLLKELGFENIFSVQLNVPIHIGEFVITAYKAIDEDVDCIYHVNAGDINILNVVDSWIDYETVDLLAVKAKWDMILWPFQTMRELEVLSPRLAKPASLEIPFEWIDQIKKLNPKYIVPSSCQFIHEQWSWYRHAYFPITYKQFQHQINKDVPLAKVVRMNPSVSFNLDVVGLKQDESIAWIKPIGLQDVDYQFDSNVLPQSTTEISKKLSTVSEKQLDEVMQYFSKVIIEKYRSVYNKEDLFFFNEIRTWKVCLYDQSGQCFKFYYKVNKNKLTLLNDNINENNFDWLTEVPICKVYAALHCGESLTSMYMRINDVFVSEINNKELAEVSCLEDPLIRCLFNSVFAGYQKAQLRRIDLF